MAQATEVQWSGTDEEQAAARTVFGLLAARGQFYPHGAPIRQSLERLVEFYSSHQALGLPSDGEELRGLLDRALSANPHVFAREETEEDLTFATTKDGEAPVERPEEVNTHTLRSRLYTAAHEPTEEDLKAVRGVGRELPELFIPMQDPVDLVFPEVLTIAPEEVGHGFIAAPDEEEVAAPAIVDRRARVGDTEVDLAEDAPYLLDEYGGLFKEMLGAYLDQDFRFVQFGGEYYLEDRLERLSRGQLRDIKEYIEERAEPLTDEEILSDALARPLQSADYGLLRFTINYRLLRERKDFRFVGTVADRLWATTTLPPLGQSLRKPAEIGQDYRYLTDAELSDQDVVTPASGEEASGRLQMRHTLTWYESENGVLPVGRAAQLLMPNPLLEDQTTVVLRVQDPQNYATHLAELRLGAAGRGTYIAGLEELFQGTLVPGAVFSLVQGAASNEFTVEYQRQPAQESRLLQYDPRRERWFFGPVVYECPVDASALLSEERVGELNGKKRASESERKKADTLLANAFRVVGEAGEGGALTALVDDLLPVMNLERPFSRQYVESLLTSSQYPQFSVEDESVGLATYTGK